MKEEFEKLYRWVELRIGLGSTCNLKQLGEEFNSAVNEIKTKSPNKDLYRTISLYPDEALEHVKKMSMQPGIMKRTLSGYDGMIWQDFVPIDIDNKDLVVSQMMTRAIVAKLELEFGLTENEMNISFSGSKGFHILLPRELIGFEPCKRIYKKSALFVKKIAGPDIKIDESIYKQQGTLRINNTINLKSGLYKIPITKEQLFGLKIEEITRLAETRQILSRSKEVVTINRRLAEFWPTDSDMEAVSRSRSEVFVTSEETDQLSGSVVRLPLPVINTQKRMCIQRMLLEQPPEHETNNTAIRIASDLAQGMPGPLVMAAMKVWNESLDRKIPDNELEATTNSAISRRYFYPCDDALLATNCDKRCFLYEKNVAPRAGLYGPDVFKTLNELKEDFVKIKDENRFVTLGIPELDAVAYGIAPQECAVLAGKTSSGKTTFAIYMAAQIHKQTQMPVLFLQQELGSSMLFEKLMAMEGGHNFGELSHLYYSAKTLKDSAFDDAVREAMEGVGGIHFVVMDRLTTEAKIKLVNSFKKHIGVPAVVFEDHLSRGKGIGLNAYEKASELGSNLKTIAKECDVPYIALAQLNRQNEDPGTPLTLGSIRDSGQVEENVDMMFGLYRPNYGKVAEDNQVAIQLLKSRRSPSGVEIKMLWEKATGRYISLERM